MAKLLFDESPLIVQPSLVVAIGFNEAITLQQLHYISLRSVEEGTVSISLRKLGTHFPFWSQHTIRRTVQSLKEQGFLEELSKPGDTGRYRVMYGKIEQVPIVSKGPRSNRGQIGHATPSKLDTPPMPDWTRTDAKLDTLPASPLSEKERDKDEKKEGVRTAALAQDVGKVLKVYGEEYSIRHGGEIFHCQFAKDTKLIKQLLAINGVDVTEILKRAVRYLEDPDTWVAKNGYSIGTFFARWNSYGDSIHNKLKEKLNGGSKTNQRGARGAGGQTTRDDLIRTLELSERNEALQREREARGKGTNPGGDRPG